MVGVGLVEWLFVSVWSSFCVCVCVVFRCLFVITSLTLRHCAGQFVWLVVEVVVVVAVAIAVAVGAAELS